MFRGWLRVKPFKHTAGNICYRHLPFVTDLPLPQQCRDTKKLRKRHHTDTFRFIEGQDYGVPLPIRSNKQYRPLVIPSRPLPRCLVAEHVKATTPPSTVITPTVPAVSRHRDMMNMSHCRPPLPPGQFSRCSSTGRKQKEY